MTVLSMIKGTPNKISDEHKGDFKEVERVQMLNKNYTQQYDYYRRFLRTIRP